MMALANLAIFAAAIAALSQEGAERSGPVLVVRAGTIWTGAGAAFAPGTIVVEGARIRSISPESDVPEGARLLEWPEGVVTPGLIDTHARLGARADALEPTEAITTGARAIDVFDPGHPDFERALRAGTTAVHLALGEGNVVAGVGAVVRTGGPEDGRVLAAEAAAKLSIGTAALRPDREPTSRAGALAALRERVAAEQGGEGGDAFARFARGEIPGFVHAPENDEVLAALRFGKGFGLRLVFVHAARCGEMEVDLSGSAVVEGPYAFSTPMRELRGPAALVAKGVPIAFGTSEERGDAASLRRTATLTVRGGLAPDAAMRALTAGAATILGVADRVGTLEPGKDADFVVWSGSPLHPASRPLAVFVLGERAGDARARASRTRRPGDPEPER
jgi:imidazolonepropionase-like amidohydrolase